MSNNTNHPTGKRNNKHKVRTPEAVQLAILAESGSQRDIARKYAVAKSTVAKIQHTPRLNQKAKEIAQIKEGLADDMLLVAKRGVDRLPELISEATDCQRVATTVGILIDKSRLISGQTTANVGLAAMLGYIHATPIDVTDSD